MNLATYINKQNYGTKDFLEKVNHIIYIVEEEELNEDETDEDE